MSLMSSVITYLLLDANVSALVGSRVYPEKLPDTTTDTPTTLPALTCQLIDEPNSTTHDGKETFKARVQIDAWGGSYKSAHSVAAAVHTALQGYHGTMGDCNIGGIFRKRKQDNSSPDIELERVSQDYMINYN